MTKNQARQVGETLSANVRPLMDPTEYSHFIADFIFSAEITSDVYTAFIDAAYGRPAR